MIGRGGDELREDDVSRHLEEGREGLPESLRRESQDSCEGLDSRRAEGHEVIRLDEFRGVKGGGKGSVEGHQSSYFLPTEKLTLMKAPIDSSADPERPAWR